MLAFSRKIFCTAHIKSRFQSETCLGQNFPRLLQHHNNNIRALCNKNFLVSSNWHILKFVSTFSLSHWNSLLCVSGEKKWWTTDHDWPSILFKKYVSGKCYGKVSKTATSFQQITLDIFISKNRRYQNIFSARIR